MGAAATMAAATASASARLRLWFMRETPILVVSNHRSNPSLRMHCGLQPGRRNIPPRLSSHETPDNGPANAQPLPVATSRQCTCIATIAPLNFSSCRTVCRGGAPINAAFCDGQSSNTTDAARGGRAADLPRQGQSAALTSNVMQRTEPPEGCIQGLRCSRPRIA